MISLPQSNISVIHDRHQSKTSLSANCIFDECSYGQSQYIIGQQFNSDN